MKKRTKKILLKPRHPIRKRFGIDFPHAGFNRPPPPKRGSTATNCYTPMANGLKLIEWMRTDYYQCEKNPFSSVQSCAYPLTIPPALQFTSQNSPLGLFYLFILLILIPRLFI